MKAITSYALSRKYTEETADSLGSLKGSPCEIQKIEYDEETGTVTITFSWTGTSGQVQTDTAVLHDGEPGEAGEPGEPGTPGLGIKSTKVKKIGEDYHLIVTYDDGSTEDAGKLPSGGGGDASLDTDVTSNLTVGAIASGTTLEEGTTFTEFVQKLLITEIAPTTTFTASGSGIKEVGTSVTPTLTLNITGKGTGTPIAIKFYSGSTLLDSQDYVDGTNSYTFTMSSAITTTTTVKGVLEYKKSDNSNATIEKTATYTFVMASYYGAVTTAPTDKAGIIALTKNVKNTKAQTATFNLANQRACYCYPASFGNLTSIKDSNGFDYISGYTKTNVTVDGESYNVYTQTDPVTASGFKQIYA